MWACVNLCMWLYMHMLCACFFQWHCEAQEQARSTKHILTGACCFSRAPFCLMISSPYLGIRRPGAHQALPNHSGHARRRMPRPAQLVSESQLMRGSDLKQSWESVGSSSIDFHAAFRHSTGDRHLNCLQNQPKTNLEIANGLILS